MTIILVKKEIRRALEGPLKAAVEGEGWTTANTVQWPGRSFDRRDKAFYYACGIIFGEVLITEFGANARYYAKGALSINVHSPLPLGPDENDRLTAIAAAAYPTSPPLVFGTTNPVTVHVDKITPGSYGSDGGWQTSLMTIDWSVYRRG